MRDDDVAGLDGRDLGSDGQHLAERAVPRVDLPAARLRDVDGVGEDRVVDVVLGRDREDLQVHVARAHRAERDRVELEHVREVELVEVAARPRALGGDVGGGDGERARHGQGSFAGGRRALRPAAGS